jgi:hypothetical protein
MMMSTGKIIRLEEKQNTLVNFLKKILEMAEKGEIKKLLIAGFLNESGEIESCVIPDSLTGYFDLTYIERQHLISTLQVDLNYNVVKANIDDLIEYIGD